MAAFIVIDLSQTSTLHLSYVSGEKCLDSICKAALRSFMAADLHAEERHCSHHSCQHDHCRRFVSMLTRLLYCKILLYYKVQHAIRCIGLADGGQSLIVLRKSTILKNPTGACLAKKLKSGLPTMHDNHTGSLNLCFILGLGYHSTYFMWRFFERKHF